MLMNGGISFGNISCEAMEGKVMFADCLKNKDEKGGRK
jgi:hypothetical protein